MRVTQLTSVFVWFVTAWIVATPAQAQPSPAQTSAYSSVWEPISGAQVQQLVKRNASNGLVLDQLWWRASLYRQTHDFMVALRESLQGRPDNAIGVAFYAKAALEWREAIANETGKKVPSGLEKEFGLSIGAIRAVLDEAQRLNKSNWVALLTEPSIKRYTGGRFPPSLEEMDYTRRALHVSDNPWTNVAFANALVTDAIYHPNQGDKAKAQRAIALLERSKRRFPRYPRIDVALFQYYAYWPLTKDPNKAREAEQRLIASIRPELRQTTPIQRYLKSIRLDGKG